jgi:hypothetical protein
MRRSHCDLPQFSPLCFRGMIGSGIKNWNRVLFLYRDAPSCVSAIALQWHSIFAVGGKVADLEQKQIRGI